MMGSSMNRKSLNSTSSGPRSTSTQTDRKLNTLFDQTLLHDIDFQCATILSNSILSMSPSSQQHRSHQPHTSHTMHLGLFRSDTSSDWLPHSTRLHPPSVHDASSSLLQSFLLQRTSSASLKILTLARHPTLTQYSTTDSLFDAIVQGCHEHSHIFIADGGVGGLCNGCNVMKSIPHVHDVAIKFRFVCDNPTFWDSSEISGIEDSISNIKFPSDVEEIEKSVSDFDTSSIPSTSPPKSVYTSPTKSISASPTKFFSDLSISPSRSSSLPSPIKSTPLLQARAEPRCDRIVPVMFSEMGGVIVTLNYSHGQGGHVIQKDLDLKRLFELESKCPKLCTGHELKNHSSILTIILVRTFVTSQSSTTPPSTTSSSSFGTAQSQQTLSGGECRRRPLCICDDTKPCHQNKRHEIKAFGIIKQPNQGVFRFRFPTSEMWRVLGMIKDRQHYENAQFFEES